MKGKIEKWVIRIRFAHERRKREVKRFVERVRAIKKRLEFLSPLFERENLVYTVMGLIVVYGIVAQLLGWV